MSRKCQDWVCPDCCITNFARNDKCRKCDCFRSKATIFRPSQPSTSQPSPISSSSRILTSLKPYQDWVCPDCYETNFARNDKCRKCDCFRSKATIFKPSRSTSQPSPTSQPFQPSPTSQPKNYNDYLKTGYQPKPGDWICVCGFQNWAKNKECRACQLVRPNINSTSTSTSSSTSTIYI